MQSITTNPPKNEHFIALYGDGSGAEIFACVAENEYCNSDGEALEVPDIQEWLLDTSFMYWVPLPSDFKFWFMN